MNRRNKSYSISAATNRGLTDVIDEISLILKDYPEDIVLKKNMKNSKLWKETTSLSRIEVFDGNYYVVTGVGVEKMMGYTKSGNGKGILRSSRNI